MPLIHYPPQLNDENFIIYFTHNNSVVSGRTSRNSRRRNESCDDSDFESNSRNKKKSKRSRSDYDDPDARKLLQIVRKIQNTPLPPKLPACLYSLLLLPLSPVVMACKAPNYKTYSFSQKPRQTLHIPQDITGFYRSTLLQQIPQRCVRQVLVFLFVL